MTDQMPKATDLRARPDWARDLDAKAGAAKTVAVVYVVEITDADGEAVDVLVFADKEQADAFADRLEQADEDGWLTTEVTATDIISKNEGSDPQWIEATIRGMLYSE